MKGKAINRKLKLVGVNAAGLSSKLHSFDKMLQDIEPSVFFIEETKMRRAGKIKTENVKKYQIFELIRKSSGGGGIAIGVINDLNPVWVGEGDDITECLSVEITAQQNFRVRCVAAYGPQENDRAEQKDKFWAHLDSEVVAAENNGTGLVIQMDGNLWAGDNIIPGDPNQQNKNGKLFEMFLRRNPHLTCVNSLQLCEGLITRIRKTKNGTELSVLDVFVVCDKMLPFIKKIIIDEARTHVLTNFNPIKKGVRAIETDHNTEILELELSYQKKKPERKEVFNFKNQECQNAFFEITSETTTLSGCFENENLTFEEQALKWDKTLNGIFHQSFRKIRVTENKPKHNEVTVLLEKRKELKQAMVNCDDDKKEELEKQLEDLDVTLASLCEEENRRKVFENFDVLAEAQGALNTNGMWNLKKKVFPKNVSAAPTAKKSFNGQLVTNPELLKQLYLDIYKHRLQHRPIRADLAELKGLKESLFKLRIKLAKLSKSEPWSENQLDKVLASLKNNKSRDPHGLINELFKPGVIGNDLKKSLLTLFNKIKDNCFIPEFAQWANITSLYKGKGERLDLKNERGIFIVSVFRSILMKLIYNDKYEVIDSNMSDSNVGARKNKNIRNHIFVINGIIHDVLSSKKKKPIDIQIMDYKQCFDSMWLEETMNDLFEVGVTDDNLALIYEANKVVNVAVKTPTGLTVRERIEKIILQGDVFGPIECSVSVDTFGKECLTDDKHLYLYKDKVKIPILAMVDDTLAVSECGYKSSMVNAFMNTKTNIKKLQFGIEKCFKMHVGRVCQEEICPELVVDGWKVKEVNEIGTGEMKLEDEHTGYHKMATVEKEKYLGDIVSQDGKNTKNIVARKNRGTGVVSQIMSILEDICFGKHYFEVAMVLRNALLISSLLTNAEAWYNLSNTEIEELEKVDESLLRSVLKCPVSTPKEMLYLELGASPIRNTIRSRRLNFLQYILHEDKNSLIYSFLKAQFSEPSKQDWGETILNDIEDFGINLTLDEIEKMPQTTFKALVRKKERISSLNYLNGIKAKHSKVLHITHSVLEMADYLKPNGISNQEAAFLFTLRSRMLDVRSNYGGQHTDTLCPLCAELDDTQAHLLVCKELTSSGTLVDKLPEYEDIFVGCLTEKVNTARILKDSFSRRKNKLKVAST